MLGRILFAAIMPLLLLTMPAAAQWGRGGWWTRVTPTTPQQKAYVEQARKLQDRIWQAQAELWKLRETEKPSPAAIAAREREISRLRDQLCELNIKNRALRQEMVGPNTPLGARMGAGRGGWGRAMGACPWGGPGQGRGMGACPWGGPGRGPGGR